jgi:Na+/H+ antiporter NhaD/arsenite permease-like protein
VTSKKWSRFLLKTIPFFIFLFTNSLAFGQEAASHGGYNGAELSLLWTIPFIGILLSIALFPLFAPDFWEHHFGKVSAGWSLVIILPMLVEFGLHVTLFEVLHTYLLEYIPFIILLLALFTIAGGVRITGELSGSPGVNTILLLIGTILASWMGTTGAAMLMIRPVLRANEWRKHKVHTIIFFIFLVANIGGALTPLGDPPLFLGFLQGVHFFWTTEHLFLEMTFVVSILLVLYYFWDRAAYNKETSNPPESNGEKIGIEGSFNLLLLLGIVGAVLFSGFVKLGDFTIYGIHIPIQNEIRDIAMLVLAYASWKFTPKESRAANGFDWFPIIEVGKLFAGIFITIIPAIAILRAGESGALGAVVKLVTHPDGSPNDHMYFWITGLLSSFLDNTPTYLVFFNTAGGHAAELMTTYASTLVAISCGAVFMGANSYIGNAPNFMVKSIAESDGVEMPSFLGYMKWSVGILIPTFIVFSLIFPYIEKFMEVLLS